MRRIKEQQHGGEIDFWETPHDAVVPILPKLQLPFGTPHEGVTLIDPGAGTGAVSIAAVLGGFPVRRIVAVENNPALVDECEARFDAMIPHVTTTVHRGDWFDFDWLDFGVSLDEVAVEGAVFLGNPPYTKPVRTIGVDFVAHALTLAKACRGVVGMLLPLDFATGKDRTDRIHSRYRTSVYPLRRRPHFGGPHSTGKRPFSWFAWDLGRDSTPTFEVIG